MLWGIILLVGLAILIYYLARPDSAKRNKGVSFSIEETFPDNYELARSNKPCNLWARPKTNLIHIYAPDCPRGEGLIAVIRSSDIHEIVSYHDQRLVANVRFIPLDEETEKLQLTIDPA